MATFSAVFELVGLDGFGLDKEEKDEKVDFSNLNDIGALCWTLRDVFKRHGRRVDGRANVDALESKEVRKGLRFKYDVAEERRAIKLVEHRLMSMVVVLHPVVATNVRCVALVCNSH